MPDGWNDHGWVAIAAIFLTMLGGGAVVWIVYQVRWIRPLVSILFALLGIWALAFAGMNGLRGAKPIFGFLMGVFILLFAVPLWLGRPSEEESRLSSRALARRRREPPVPKERSSRADP